MGLNEEEMNQLFYLGLAVDIMKKIELNKVVSYSIEPSLKKDGDEVVGYGDELTYTFTVKNDLDPETMQEYFEQTNNGMNFERAHEYERIIKLKSDIDKAIGSTEM